jgi:putative membrane protein
MFQGDITAAVAFTWRWQWSTTIIAVLAAIELVYITMWAGVRIRIRRVHLPWVRLVAFTAGVAAIVIADLSPIGANDEQFLSMHMLGHDLFIWIAAPLMVLGVEPLFEHADELPRIVRASVAFLAHPLVAWLLSTALLWIWHSPANYDRALSNSMLHAFEHACFLVGYGIYWWPLIASAPTVGGLRTNAARAGYLLAGAMQSALLGALIMFHEGVLYSHYLNLSGLAGSSVLEDQRLAGALMLFPGAVVFALAAVLVVRRPPQGDRRISTEHAFTEIRR